MQPEKLKRALEDGFISVEFPDSQTYLLYQGLIHGLQIELGVGYETRMYTPVFVALVDAMDLQETLYPYLSLSPYSTESQIYMARLAIAKAPLKGKRFLEIGGPFGVIIAGLGATVWGVDPDFGQEISEFTQVDWRYDPARKPWDYTPIPQRLTADNWGRLLPGAEFFDACYTLSVLSINSGTSGDWRRGAAERGIEYREAGRRFAQQEAVFRRDLFQIVAQVTRLGGYVVHEGDAVIHLLQFASSANLDLLQVRCTENHYTRETYTYIFQKLIPPTVSP